MSSDLSDSDFDDVDSVITSDHHKLYQVQFVSDDNYKFSLLGYFKEEFSIELTRFEHSDLFCVIRSNMSIIDDEPKSGKHLYDIITMDVLKKDGKQYKLILSVEIDNPQLNKENNKGNLMIWIEYEGYRTPIKTNLTHPGNEKIPYYIINELKNDKINEIIK